MAFQCEICGKRKQHGHNISFSQRKTKRVWKPNLQIKRIDLGEGVMKLKVCTRCLKSLKNEQVKLAKTAA